MHRGAIACTFLLLVGCADFNFSTEMSILGAMNDGAGLPKYLGKHQSRVTVNGTPSELQNAYSIYSAKPVVVVKAYGESFIKIPMLQFGDAA